MKILMTGATGFIGRKLLVRLFRDGHDLVLLSRNSQSASKNLEVPCQIVEWDLMKGPPPVSTFEGVHAVIHLAGESLAAARWTPAQKQKIRNSRKVGTQNLVQGFNQPGTQTPSVFISASAVGIYGDRNDEELFETSPPGQGFLAEVCNEWESAIHTAKSPKTRVVTLRLGVVLGREGGALTKMLTPFSLGLGATLGSGQQWMSWVHIDDVVEAFCMALKNKNAQGPIHVVAPIPVTNREFTLAFAAVLHKKALLKAPAKLLQIILGDMSEALLNSARAIPKQLTALGFKFAYPSLQKALDQICVELPNQVFESIQFIPKPIDEVFVFFSETKNLETITPPWLNFKVVSQTTETIRTGTEIRYRLKVHGIPIQWKSRIHQWKLNESFSDEQIKGPYAKWYHTHEFESLRGGTLVKDHVAYQAPLGQIGKAFVGGFIKSDIGKIFSFRRNKLTEVFK